ncbi:hypothetical protein C8R46DRAFT_1191559 [Mycena filopes]|nr:hypothetical protein C8R46DRAFT_1191559 [Mycena filopes]
MSSSTAMVFGDSTASKEFASSTYGESDPSTRIYLRVAGLGPEGLGSALQHFKQSIVLSRLLDSTLILASNEATDHGYSTSRIFNGHRTGDGCGLAWRGVRVYWIRRKASFPATRPVSVGVHVRWGDTAASNGIDDGHQFYGSMSIPNIRRLLADIRASEISARGIELSIAMEHADHGVLALLEEESGYRLIDTGDSVAVWKCHLAGTSPLAITGIPLFRQSRSPDRVDFYSARAKDLIQRVDTRTTYLRLRHPRSPRALLTLLHIHSNASPPSLQRRRQILVLN